MTTPEPEAPAPPQIYNPVSKRVESMTDLQAKAMDPQWAKENPTLAAMHTWRPDAPENTFAYGLGDWARRATLPGLANATNAGALPGGAAGAAYAALPVLAGSWLYNNTLGGDRPLNTALLTALAALTGGGLGAYSGYHRSGQAAAARQTAELEKPAGWRAPGKPMMFMGPQQQLSEKLYTISDYSGAERSRMMMAVQQLAPAQAAELWRLVGSLGGAAAGAVIARYLMGAGLLGTAVGAGLGLMAGRALFPGSVNSVGLPTRAGPYMGGTYNF